jgi:uncharacterized phage-like protein YoqJ
MAACTFFGHRDCPDAIKLRLREVLVDLITNHGVDIFYVGNQGRFDTVVHSTLVELAKDYPGINYAVVLAYMPKERCEHDEYSDTMLPEGIETIHPRYAISWRNDWMLRRSDYVVTYIKHSWGGAARYAEKAKRKGKVMVELGSQGR